MKHYLFLVAMLAPLLCHTTVNAATSTTTTTTWTRPESCRSAVTRDDAALTSTTASHRRLLSSNTNTTKIPATTTTTSSSSSHTSGTHAHASAQEVGFLTLCMFLGVVTRTFVEPKLLFHFIPYTVILILTGLLIGVLSIFTQYDDGTNAYNFRCHLAAVQPHGGRSGCNITNSELKCSCESWFDRLNVNILANVSPHVILYVFLPPLIFER